MGTAPSSNIITVSPYALVNSDNPYEFVIETIDQFDAVTYHFFKVLVIDSRSHTVPFTGILQDSNSLDDYLNFYHDLLNNTLTVGHPVS